MKRRIAGSLVLLVLLVLLAVLLGREVHPGRPAGVSPAPAPTTTSAAARAPGRPYQAVVEVDEGNDGTVEWRTVYHYDGEGRLQQVQSMPVAPTASGQQAPTRAPGDV